MAEQNFENCNHRLSEKARLFFFEMQAKFGSDGVFHEREFAKNEAQIVELRHAGFLRNKRDGLHCARQPIGVPRGRELDAARGKRRRMKA